MPLKKTEFKDEQTEKIIGIAMKIHRELGYGFLEAVYQEVFEYELKNEKIPYEREKQINISYCGNIMKTFYRADFLCFNEIIIELKAIANITTTEYSQTINYLKASNISKALLINFGAKSLQLRRFENKFCQKK